MNESKISVRYAKALLLSAKENNLLKEIYSDMKWVYQISREVNEFYDFIESPIITPSQKRNIIHAVFENITNKLTLSFLDLIVKNRRETYIPDISRRFLDIYKKYMGITSVILTTVVRVDDELKERIIKLIQDTFHTEVELTEKMNDELIGGFILRLEDKMMDASVANELKKMRKNLTGSGV